ncbi:protein kinase domain-containing protein [Rubinisphaera margarita]|uniref:protein kinase domain-containing protein n=1 Tax=Rubinisphaera margarita TaxID=2909586 RepID=UPI001EE97F2B|nr:SUMF1/EgtB/PvdO family nonheme iron enzyme [Rubinisphaera margarita]MCG6158222.1 SUMF1/EgtB/PvdO family nonheme iron enzyme [Rubinisphaera margarita]
MSSRKQFLSQFRRQLGAAFQSGSSNTRKLVQLTRDLPFGSRLAEYRIIRKIGQGGMGAVYEAEHVELRKSVALKRLHSHLAESTEAQERFRREMQASGVIADPHIVRAHDARFIDGEAVLVLELLRGGDLRRLLKWRAPVSIAAACEIARQAALALDHLDSHGFVHRDIKPSNLFLDIQLNENGTVASCQVKVLDLGLARLRPTAADQTLTGDGQIIGTEDYIAPEQIRGADVDIRADLYSLGCTLYYLIGGRSPFRDSNTTYLKLHAHLYKTPPRLETLVAGVPESLERLVEELLSKSANERGSSPREIADRLSQFSEESELLDLAGKFAEYCGLRADPVDGESSTLDLVPRDVPTGAFRDDAAPRKLDSRKAGRVVLALIGVIAAALLLVAPGKRAEQAAAPKPISATLLRLDRGELQGDRRANPARALFLDGIDDCIRTPFVLKDEYHFTMEMWFTPFGTLDQRKKELISNAEAAGISISLKEDRYLRFLLHDGGTYVEATSEEEVHLGERVHLAAVYDGISLALYVNGRPHGTKVPFRNRHRASPLPLHLGANPDPQLVGRDVETLRDCFRGLIHEFRLSSGVRYVEPFTPQLKLPSDEATEVLYHIDDQNDSSQTVLDRSGNNRHGTIIGATWVDDEDLRGLNPLPQFEWNENLPEPAIAALTTAEAQRVQADWAAALSIPAEQEMPVPGASPLSVRLVPPGEFAMGTDAAGLSMYLAAGDGMLSEGERQRLNAESPRHKVQITRPFYMSVEKVTHEQVLAAFRSEGREWTEWKSYVQAMNLSEDEEELELSEPATRVSWDDATFFCTWLNEQQSGYFVTLPTEAQWEHACRAGTTTDWSVVDADRQALFTMSPEEAIASHSQFLQGGTNAWGLLNMHGTPLEWCRDSYRRTAYSTRTRTDPFVTPVDNYRNLRGGDAQGRPVFSRSAYRHYAPSKIVDPSIGFRVILEMTSE